MPATAVAVPTARDTDWSAEDLAAHLGDIPLRRIRLNPPPGTATIQDVIDINDHGNCICELIDGTLVEKAMGWNESRVGLRLGRLLDVFVEEHGLGAVCGEAGM